MLVHPGITDQFVRLVEESLPTVKAQKGFRGYMSGVDRSTNRCLVVALRDTEAHVKEFTESQLYRELMTPLAPCLAALPEWGHFEVALQP